MKYTVMVIVSLMSFLLGCNLSLAAKRENSEVPIFLIKPKEMNAEEYVSELGRFYIMSDLIRDKDKEYLAVIKISDIDGKVPLIDLVRVFIYQNDCSDHLNILCSSQGVTTHRHCHKCLPFPRILV